jgi:reductive dehalogenase
MKKLSLGEWEEQYVVGPVERFDQKNTMSVRKYADPVMKDRLSGLSAPAAFEQVPGHTLQDYALRWAPRHFHSLIAELNSSKPNPNPLSIKLKRTMEEANKALSYQMNMSGNTSIDTANPDSITRDIKNTAAFFGADMVGICALDSRWIYSHTCEKEIASAESYTHKPQDIPEAYEHAIVMGFEANYQMLKYVQTYIGGAAHDLASSKMVNTSALLSQFISILGYKAIDCNIDDVVITVPLAMQAGLGQLGRHGMLITPQFGPRVRLSVVLTNLPLIPDAPIDFGVTQFCNACRKCARMCPSGSISFGEQTAESVNVSNSSGGMKWPQNGETCLMRAARDRYPCSACVSCCPYNKPDTRFHRTVRWLTDHARWADSFYVWMDDIFGYGKPKKADGFWDKAEPQR